MHWLLLRTDESKEQARCNTAQQSKTEKKKKKKRKEEEEEEKKKKKKKKTCVCLWTGLPCCATWR